MFSSQPNQSVHQLSQHNALHHQLSQHNALHTRFTTGEKQACMFN